MVNTVVKINRIFILLLFNKTEDFWLRLFMTIEQHEPDREQ